MAMANTHTARWFVELFRQYSLSVEYWKVLAEAKLLECDQLQSAVQSLEKQRAEIAAARDAQEHVVAQQKNVIHSLMQNTQPPKAKADHGMHLPIQPPSRPGTPWPPELVLSPSLPDSDSNRSFRSVPDTPLAKRRKIEENNHSAGEDDKDK